MTAAHPRYAGPVVDAHCHYDASTRDHAPDTCRAAGVATAINLWDLQWPPAEYARELAAWTELEPAIVRCHVPDLSRIGAPGHAHELARATRQAAALGAVGVKVWKNLGLWERDLAGHRVAIDDARLQPLWDAAAECGLPVTIHIGDPPAFFAPLDERNPRIGELRIHPDWWYGGGDFPELGRLHEEFERLVSSHPQTTFVGMHLGCFMAWHDVARMLRSHRNYHVDTAAAIADMGKGDVSQVRALCLDFSERIVFGTDLVRAGRFDMPDGPGSRWDLGEFFARHWRFFETGDRAIAHPLPNQGNWTVTGLALPDDVLHRLYCANAVELFRLSLDGPKIR